MPGELRDVINEVPPELLDPEANTDTDIEDEAEVDDEVETDEATPEEGDEAAEGEADEAQTDEDASDEDDDNEDYFTTAEEEPETPVATTTPTPITGAAGEDESKFVLDGLAKISVNIINKDDKVETVSVYGYGDLPRDYKGIATPYEAGVFQTAVTQQLNKIDQLRGQYQQTQVTKQNEAFVERENRAIAEDITELRQEGVFPKFRGTPGTKEFNESDGAKEFDRVVEFMNTRNDDYAKRAQSGKSYRHIGFREAYEMLNGPAKAQADKAENSARRKAAGKTVSRRGTSASTARQPAGRVNNLNDLADEFTSLVSQ